MLRLKCMLCNLPICQYCKLFNEMRLTSYKRMSRVGNRYLLFILQCQRHFMLVSNEINQRVCKISVQLANTYCCRLSRLRGEEYFFKVILLTNSPKVSDNSQYNFQLLLERTPGPGIIARVFRSSSWLRECMRICVFKVLSHFLLILYLQYSVQMTRQGFNSPCA